MRQRLFERMRCDMGVMAEWGDDEAALLAEVMTCDDEVLQTYLELWEVES